MRKALLAVLPAVLALLVPHAAHGIVYGEPDNGEHPNVGAVVAVIHLPDEPDPVRFRLCSATLVAPDVVLSAAHCFGELGLPEGATVSYHVTFADIIDVDRGGFVDASVSLLPGTVQVHPSYGSGGANDTHDLAVFVLEAPVSITPARLPGVGVLDDRSLREATFTAVGYGTVRETNRKAFQSFLPGWRREQADQHLLSVTKAWVTFSMNLATGDGGTCYGDSGGPHFLDDVLVSVTVTGDAVCKATDKTYRVDTPEALDFLGQFVTLP